MKLIIIASGSKSNAALVEHDGAAVLIDCGVSRRALVTALCENGLSEQNLKAVFVTHSHSDHVCGLATLHKHLNIPFLSAADVDLCQPMPEPFEDFGFKVSAFDCSHDVRCVGYKITCAGKSVCIATDTGVVTDGIRDALLGCETVVIESNHDIDMLRFGSYPPSLKSRIMSDKGHLSNKDCAELLCYLASNGLRRAVLAHLSENNNTPLVAKSTARERLDTFGFDVELIAAAPGVIVEI